MPRVVGVIVRKIKEKIYAQPKHLTLELNETVIVETEHGVEVGFICEKEKEMEQPADIKFGVVIRKANEHDIKRLENNEHKNDLAWDKVYEKISEINLDMKLTSVNYTFDRTKLFIYYTSETRVDFREFIKVLGHALKTRIQMVQIGVRDEAKIIGGIGTCGQQLCCKMFLKDFNSVTIDMAKDQDLSLNTTKLSGLCGRLMCCLVYEHELYAKLKKSLPAMGAMVGTPNGKGKLVSINCVKETCGVEFDERNIKNFKITQIKEIENNGEKNECSK
ncbi:MAG: regulatory iron-sulfur-containing complex subunit RicT [Endomicrobiaceae bacterium]|nr:regulatory iron-sulfur-containing complex subunit RicT [Endomicrobiaceae bacterium]